MSGWNRPNEQTAPVKRPAKPILRHGIFAGLVAVALGLVALFILSDKDAAPAAKNSRSSARDVPTSRPRDVPASRLPDSSASQPLNPSTPPPPNPSTSQSLNSSTSQPSNPSTSQPRPVLENGTDQLIAMAVAGPDSAPIPPLPAMTAATTEKFLESLKKPIEISEGDSEAVKAIKQQVQATREQIAEWMEAEPGKGLGDILNEHRNEFNHALNLQNEVRKGLQEYLDADDMAGAKHYLTMMNIALQQVGVAEVEMPEETEEGEDNQ